MNAIDPQSLDAPLQRLIMDLHQGTTLAQRVTRMRGRRQAVAAAGRRRKVKTQATDD